MADKHWIQTAIEHHGAATEAANRAGMTVQEWAHAHMHDAGVAGKRARLAITLHELHHGEAHRPPLERAMG